MSDADPLRAALGEMLRKRHYTAYAEQVCPCCSATRALLARFPSPADDHAE
jgi:hypothetical protein